MKPSTLYYVLLITAATIYYVTSYFVFDKVFKTSKIVIDELFHIPQGLAFCNRNFTYWDPKITTLPGLYLASTAFVGSFLECNSYNLRLLNLVASGVNLLLFSSILNFIYSGENKLKIILQAVNLVILPPLYFFSHVYYTDTLSLTCLLVVFRLSLVNRFKFLIFAFGLLSILMRQTNVIWIAMIFGHKALDIMIKSSRVYGNKYLTKSPLNNSVDFSNKIDKSKLKRYYNVNDAISAIRFHVTKLFAPFFKSLTIQDTFVLTIHGLILCIFAAFLCINGSIVVGDKTAHTATLHIPQLLYFLLFYGLFGLPYVLVKIPSTIKLIFNNKLKVIFIAVLMLCAVEFNTIEHPYLLADNRHYTFYVWNRWFGKYWYAKYATVPVYIFLLFSLYDNLKEQNCISFLLPYTICAFIVLALQRMIEIRYFLVPYLILRLRFQRPSLFLVTFEFILYLAINVATFYLFFHKEIMWKDFKEVQRLIW